MPATDVSNAGRTDRLWHLLNESKFMALVLGFLLTTVAGGQINRMVQEGAWEREKRFQNAHYRLEQGAAVVQDISTAINARKRGLWQLYSLANQDPGERFNTAWDRYSEVVADWNTALQTNRSRLALFLGAEYANRFLDSTRSADPETVHGRFVEVTRRYDELRRCIRVACPTRAVLAGAARDSNDWLNSITDHFVMDATKSLLGSFGRLDSLQL
jgi:hypothetical protein